MWAHTADWRHFKNGSYISQAIVILETSRLLELFCDLYNSQSGIPRNFHLLDIEYSNTLTTWSHYKNLQVTVYTSLVVKKKMNPQKRKNSAIYQHKKVLIIMSS